MNRYKKGKTRKGETNLDLLEEEIVSGSGICWAICRSAPHPRQPQQHPTTQLFTGRMPFLPPNQQHQSTEGAQVRGVGGGVEISLVQILPYNCSETYYPSPPAGLPSNQMQVSGSDPFSSPFLHSTTPSWGWGKG